MMTRNLEPSRKVNRDEPAEQNIIQRLNLRISDAKQLGFQVRSEVFDGEQATWCVIGKSKILFMDLSQSAHEQLRQINESLESYLATQQCYDQVSEPSRAA